MKCDNCKEYPSYILKPGTAAEQLFCNKHLPHSLQKKAKFGHVKTVAEYLDTLALVSAQSIPVVEKEVVEEQPTKKSKKKAVAEPETLPVVEEEVVTVEEEVIEDTVAEAVVDESDNADSN